MVPYLANLRQIGQSAVERADIGRLFDLLQLLRSHRYPITAAKLATELEVTVRTVYRDILTLLALGARWVSQRADSRLARAARNALARIEAVLPTKLREYRGRDN